MTVRMENNVWREKKETEVDYSEMWISSLEAVRYKIVVMLRGSLVPEGEVGKGVTVLIMK